MSGRAHLSTLTTAAFRRPGSRRTRGVAVCALLLSLAGLSGCGDEPVQIDLPLLSAADDAACDALVDDLPDLLHDLDRRLVSPAAAHGAAWGDPAIVLRCGTEMPEGLDEFSECLEANGVGWFLPPEAEDDAGDETDPADVTIAAAGYRPVVSVTIPGEYRPEGVAAVTAGLAEAVDANLELVDPCV